MVEYVPQSINGIAISANVSEKNNTKSFMQRRLCLES